MIKIAILTTGDLEDMKGVMNYVNEKNYQFIINNDGYFITISLKKQTFLDDFKKNKIKHFDIRKRTKFVIQILLKYHLNT